MFRPLHAAFFAISLLARAQGTAAEKADLPNGEGSPTKSAADLIKRQEPLRLVVENYMKSTPANTRYVVNLTTQRLVMLVAGEVCIDSPISSGKRGVSGFARYLGHT